MHCPNNKPKEWKEWQKLYNSMVTEHSDAAFLHKREICNDREKFVENALFYIEQKADYGIYPAKSYVVAIIFATMINKVYGDDFYETLDDPDLLYGQDDFFVPYRQDPEMYDRIIEALTAIPNWIEQGWAPKTVEYFNLECTEAGFSQISSAS